MKTLLLALISPNKSIGTREGAIRGLIGVGKEAVRKGLVEGGGAKVVASDCLARGDAGPLIQSVKVRSIRLGLFSILTFSAQDALRVFKPPLDTDMTDSLDPTNDSDMELISRLHETLGDFFAKVVAEDAAWARAVLGINTESVL
jgi:transcription initiation factor TFIID subunit 6